MGSSPLAPAVTVAAVTVAAASAPAPAAPARNASAAPDPVDPARTVISYCDPLKDNHCRGLKRPLRQADTHAHPNTPEN